MTTLRKWAQGGVEDQARLLGEVEMQQGLEDRQDFTWQKDHQRAKGKCESSPGLPQFLTLEPAKDLGSAPANPAQTDRGQWQSQSEPKLLRVLKFILTIHSFTHSCLPQTLITHLICARCHYRLLGV